MGNSDDVVMENDDCWQPPTLDEVTDQINAIKNSKAPGIDNIAGEMIKVCWRGIAEMYTYFNRYNLDRRKNTRGIGHSYNMPHFRKRKY